MLQTNETVRKNLHQSEVESVYVRPDV